VRCGKIELNLERKKEFKAPSHASLTAGDSIDAKRTRLAILLVNRAVEKSTAVTVQLKNTGFTGRSVRFDVLSSRPDAVNTVKTPNLIKIRQLPAQLTGSTINCRIPSCSAGVLYMEGDPQ